MKPEPIGALEALTQFVYLAPIGILRFDAAGAIEMMNPTAAQLLFPLTPSHDMTNAFSALAPLAPDLATLVAAFNGEAGPILLHHRCELTGVAGGPPVVISLTVNRIADDVHMAIVEDVSRLVEQERVIFADQQRFNAIFNHIRDYAIFTIDLLGRVEEWNPSLGRLGDWTAADVNGQHLSLFFYNGGAATVDQLLIEAQRTGSTETDGWLKRRDGSRQWANTVITALPNAHGEVSGFVVVTRDMSERKRADDELRRLATTDPLTGAYNRRWGLDRLSDQLRNASGATSVLMLDIDHFKRINDVFGHVGGDAALRRFVDTCTGLLDAGDALVRWGGEEFLAILRSNAPNAEIIAERIRAEVAAASIDVAGTRLQFTVSIGVAAAGGGNEDDLVRRADRALYAAKAGGRNRVVVDQAPLPSS